MFQEEDYEWLQVISCLKKTGMSLKDIRKYIDMALEWDATINERLKLFEKQREIVRAQMAELQETLETLNFKCWYYETAAKAGSTTVPMNMTLDEIPEKYRDVRKRLKHIPQIK